MRKNLILGTILAVLLILSIPLISGSTISSEKEILSKKESINDKTSDSYCILLRAQLDFLEGLIRSLIKYFEEQEIDGVVNILNSMIDAFEKTYEEKCGDSSEYQDSSSTLKEF